MSVEVWADFIVVLQSVQPALSEPDGTTCTRVLRWSKSHRNDYYGIPENEKDLTMDWIRTIRDQFSGDSRDYLIECIDFIRSLNYKVAPATYHSRRGCEIRGGYYWYDDRCHADREVILPEEKTPSDYHTRVTCKAAGFYWFNDACHDRRITLEDVRTEEDCITWGGYWYSGACHTTPPVDVPPILTGLSALAEQVACYCETISSLRIIEKGICIILRNWLRVIAGFQEWLSRKS